MQRRILFITLLIFSLTFAACSDDDEKDTDNGQTTEDVISDDATEDKSDATEDTTDDEADATDDATDDEADIIEDEVIEIPEEPVGSCEEISSNTCLANADCAGSQRCQSVGADEYGDPVPCCVTGERGDKEAGEICDVDTGELECASGLCIDGSTGTLCSAVCESEADCPEGLKECDSIMFSGSDVKFCQPTRS